MTAFFPSMAAFRGKFINFLIKRNFTTNVCRHIHCNEIYFCAINKISIFILF